MNDANKDTRQPRKTILPDTDEQKLAKERRRERNQDRRDKYRGRQMSVMEFFNKIPDDAAARPVSRGGPLGWRAPLPEVRRG